MKPHTVAVAFLLNLAVASFAAANPPIDVYIITGQSNAVGNGANSDLPANYLAPSPHQIVVGGTTQVGWGPLRPGLGNNAGVFGPELGIGAQISTSEDLE